MPPTPLSPSGRRAVAAIGLGTATRIPPFVASVLVDVLDALSWSLLAVAGATPNDARAVLAALWVEPTTEITGGER
ncbi:MAG: hypothetical protein ACJ73E_08715 [Mycobacteriales bacterium]